VDNSQDQLALGVVVPKRHARRAVTRNLIRRLARAVFALHAPRLPAGCWLLRLKAPFSPREFVSAASPALATAVREELDRLLASVVRRPARGAA
jgi:ribonuclease P protein component